jgi:hypothetical protein
MVYAPTGQCLQSFSAYDDALGVRALSISSLGMLAAGSCDDKVWPEHACAWVGFVSVYVSACM